MELFYRCSVIMTYSEYYYDAECARQRQAPF